MSLGLIISPQFKSKHVQSTLLQAIDRLNPNQIVCLTPIKAITIIQTISRHRNIPLSVSRNKQASHVKYCIAFLGSNLENERNALQIISRLRKKSCPVDVYFDSAELIKLRTYQTRGGKAANVNVMIYVTRPLSKQQSVSYDER